jgi:hypothetical protein
LKEEEAKKLDHKEINASQYKLFATDIRDLNYMKEKLE